MLKIDECSNITALYVILQSQLISLFYFNCNSFWKSKVNNYGGMIFFLSTNISKLVYYINRRYFKAWFPYYLNLYSPFPNHQWLHVISNFLYHNWFVYLWIPFSGNHCYLQNLDVKQMYIQLDHENRGLPYILNEFWTT